MADREKVIKGIECCEALHNGGKVQCLTKCPYFKRSDGSIDENCRGGMIYDALSLLKSKEPHVITKDDFSRCDDFGYIPAVFEPIDMKNFLNWEWSIITQNALSRNDGRYWSGLPSDEQREDVEWDE